METPSPHLHLAPRPGPPLPAEDTALLTQMINDFRARQKSGGMRDKSIEQELRVIDSLVRHSGKPPWRWIDADFEAWSADLAKKKRLTPASQRKYQGAIRRFFTWLLESHTYPYLLRDRYGVVLRQLVTRHNAIPHLLEYDNTRPTPGFTPQDLIRFFTVLDELISEAHRFHSKSLKVLLRDRVIFRLMYYFGLRLAEVATLTPRSFFPNGQLPDFGAYACVEVAGKAPRGQAAKRRSIATISADVRELLEAYLEYVRPLFLGTAKGETDRLFLSERGRPICLGAISYRFRHILREAQLQGNHLTTHSLRRAYATHCLEAGIDLDSVRERLGHVYLSTTQRYVRPGTQYLVCKAHDTFEAINEARKAAEQQAFRPF